MYIMYWKYLYTRSKIESQTIEAYKGKGIETAFVKKIKEFREKEIAAQ